MIDKIVIKKSLLPFLPNKKREWKDISKSRAHADMLPGCCSVFNYLIFGLQCVFFYRPFQGNSIESKHGRSNRREFALFSSLKNTQCIDFTIKALNSMWGIKFLVLVPTVPFAFGIVPGWRLIRWICLLVTVLLSQWTTGCAFLLWLWCFVFSHFAIPFHPTVRFEIPFHAVVPLIWLTKMFVLFGSVQ